LKHWIVKSERKTAQLMGNARLLASMARLYFGIVIGSWGIKREQNDAANDR